MAQRARLLTAEDVLEELELGDDYDDLDEPKMAGNDDEFSDCDLDENENDDNDDSTNLLTSIQPQQGSSGASSPSLSRSASPPLNPSYSMVIRTELSFHRQLYVSCWPHSCSPRVTLRSL